MVGHLNHLSSKSTEHQSKECWMNVAPEAKREFSPIRIHTTISLPFFFPPQQTIMSSSRIRKFNWIYTSVGMAYGALVDRYCTKTPSCSSKVLQVCG